MGKIIPQRLGGHPNNHVRAVEKPKLLAPAGSWDCARAAVENGADAIYFGLPQFNARMRADNFTLDDLPELMRFLHSRGVMGYVTLNTLVFTHELEQLIQFVRAIVTAQVDAAIVQDPGVCQLIRQVSQDFPIHASTQMTITSRAGIEFARQLGCSLVVLARECSLKEVADIHQKQIEEGIELPLEIFVHGALCVAYSGQCLTSESLGGRSANRGECAQACRLPYDLISDGAQVDLNGRPYLLSPQDLSGVDCMDEAIAAGVSCFKIEGRLKSPDYVAAVSQVYRKAIDHAWHRYIDAAPSPAISPEDTYQLEMTFSRGLYSGWLKGIDNQQLVHARYGKKRGVLAGEVVSIHKGVVWVNPHCTLKAGEGVVFASDYTHKQEEGGYIYSVQVKGDQIGLSFAKDALHTNRLHPGQLMYKTADPALEKSLRQSYQVEQPNYKRGVTLHVQGAVNQPLTITAQLESDTEVTLSSDTPLQPSEGNPLSEKTLRKQLGRLGASPFYLQALNVALEGDCFLPISTLNSLRRSLVDALIAKQVNHKRWTQTDTPIELPQQRSRENNLTQVPYLIPYVRSFEQLKAVLNMDYAEVYIELEDPRKYAQAIATVRQQEQLDSRKRSLWIAPPRIFKTGEDWILRLIEKLDADGLLVRNHEHLEAWKGKKIRGDFSLNITNPLSAHIYHDTWKLDRLTASYDLTAEQLGDLLLSCPPGWFEITLHQHMPMFHMEHCVFCAFLSSGKDFRDCGRPCEKHTVSLRDRLGQEHPLRADAGCRNTVFNARAQTGADYAHELIDCGAVAFRIEFLRESPQAVTDTLQRYESLLKKEITGADLWKEFKLINQLGVTRGTMK